MVGLYTSVLPSAVYALFGSSMQLAVGPVAVVSLLTGTIVAKYVPDYSTNTTDAMNIAAQVALCCGIILTVFSVLNLGDFIRYVSHSVMSGFTTGAACVIGLNQLKGAFGFYVSVPQAGQSEYEYNYQVMKWYVDNWNGVFHYSSSQLTNPKYQLLEGNLYRNKYATQVMFMFNILCLFICIFFPTKLIYFFILFDSCRFASLLFVS